MKFNNFSIGRNKSVLLAFLITLLLSYASSRLPNQKNNKRIHNSLTVKKQINIKTINKLINDVSKNLESISTKQIKTTENKYENVISSKANNVYRYKTRPSRLQKTNIKTLNTKVKCPLGTALNGFRIGELSYKSRNDFIDSNIFEYNCYKHKLILDKFLNFKTEKIVLEKSDFKNSNVNKLLKLKIKCPEAYLVTKFRLAFTNQNEIYYRYQCSETDVDDEVCAYSESNRFNIPIQKRQNNKNVQNIKNTNDKKNSKKANKKAGKKNNKNEKKAEDKKDQKEKEITQIINLESLKKLYVEAPQGKFIKTFQLKFDEAKSEIFYKIKSCRIIDEEEEENDPEYELEEDEEFGEPELQEEEEKEIMNLPQEVLNKAQKLNAHSSGNSNVVIEPENENEEFNKKYENFELITIGNVPAKVQRAENNRNEGENE